MSWAALDAGQALKQAEATCRASGAGGPVLTRLIDGWEATAYIIEGRRFHRTLRSRVHRTPDAALEELVVLVELERLVALS